MGGWLATHEPQKVDHRCSFSSLRPTTCTYRREADEYYDYNSKKRYLVLQLVLMVTARKQNGLNQSTRSKDEQKLRLGYRLPEREKKREVATRWSEKRYLALRIMLM